MIRDVRYVPVVLFGSALTLLALLLAADLWNADTINNLQQRLPDKLSYLVHATAGEASTRVGVSPWYSATQWVKAAAHAERPADVDKAVRGIADARKRAGYDPSLDDYLCSLSEHDLDRISIAVSRAGVSCVGS